MFKNKIRMFFLLALTFVGSMIGLQNVNAATDKISADEYIRGPYYYMHKQGSRSKWEQTKMIKRNSDGAFVYCVQPFVEINSDSTYNVTTEDMASVTNISYENWKKIEKIAYYGYGYNENGIDHTDIRWYPATQMLIWKYADPTVDNYFTTTSGGQRNDSILANEMAEINRLTDSHTTTPNFTDLPTEMVIGNTITINDSNNVLSSFNVKNVVGGNISINGNSLNITATQVGDMTFSLNKNGNRYGEPTRLYYATDSQNVVRRGNIDPIRKPMKIKVLGGTVTPNKYDDETFTNKPQGEATLEGAVYGIYKDDGTKVGIVTTDKNGKATSDYLPSLGKFYLLEEKASNGYQLDKNKYYFEITPDNLFPEVQVFEKVISLDFDFTKVYANDKTGFMSPEEGVVFGIYNNKGEEVRRLTTDSQGNIKFKLPYGTYIVKQLTSTFGHEKADDFTIEVREVGPVVKKVIANAEIKAKLKVVKVDLETGNVIKISGIKFKILNTDKNEYVCQNITYPTSQKVCVFETDRNGEFITPYPLESGHYKLEEVDQVIDKYLWNKGSKEFTIGDDSKLINDSEYGILFEVRFENKEVKGTVKATKKGEIVELKENGYEYKEIDLEGVKIGLYANENITNGTGKVIYKKGDLVKEVLTDKDGNIKVDNLHLGKYYLQEIETVGEHVLDKTKYEFELKYKDQYTEKVEYTTIIKNHLGTGKLEFTKTDFSTSEPLPNTKMEIYTEDDELIFTGVTDEFGKIIIDRLPIGKYYILEKEAPEGWEINPDKMFFEIKEDGEIVKSVMKDNQIVEVPDTYMSEGKLNIVIAIIFGIVGIITIIYGLRQEKNIKNV